MSCKIYEFIPVINLLISILQQYLVMLSVVDCSICGIVELIPFGIMLVHFVVHACVRGFIGQSMLNYTKQVQVLSSGLLLFNMTLIIMSYRPNIWRIELILQWLKLAGMTFLQNFLHYLLPQDILNYEEQEELKQLKQIQEREDCESRRKEKKIRIAFKERAKENRPFRARKHDRPQQIREIYEPQYSHYNTPMPALLYYAPLPVSSFNVRENVYPIPSIQSSENVLIIANQPGEFYNCVLDCASHVNPSILP